MPDTATDGLLPLSIEQYPDGADHDIHHARRLLYTSHILSTWNSRLFEFGAFLFLASLYPSTLLPASVYALVRAAAGAVLSPWVGGYIDSHDRLQVVRISITSQRIAVLLSCTVFIFMLFLSDFSASTTGFALALSVLSILACVEKLGIVGNTIAIERDWVVVIADGSESSLNQLNSRMRRIDLFCKLVAPLAISLVDAYSIKVAVISTGALSMLSWLVEYFAIARVYQAFPGLRSSKENDTSASSHGLKSFGAFSAAIKSYATSAALLPSLSLSFLYLTALSFNGQLITYLLAPPTLLPAVALSAVRGISACAELSATFFAPRLISHIGALRTGSWFLNAQLIFVAVAASALWVPVITPTAQAVLLISAVVLSRVGLWGFDLAAQQQIQDEVPESARGAFSSIEAALQNAFEMVSFAATIIWTSPEQFRYPAALSALAVLAAAILYASFVRQRRGHLLHFGKGLCGAEYWKTHFGMKSPSRSRGWTQLATEDTNE